MKTPFFVFYMSCPISIVVGAAKMSASRLRLASYNLSEHYGDMVRDLALCTLKKGGATLAEIKQETKMNINKIKKALCVLIQHNLVKYQSNARQQIYYTALISNILLIHNYPRYTYCSKMLFGDAAELLVEELLHHGSLTMTTLVQNVTNRLLDPALSQSEQMDQHHVAKQFELLVQGHFIKRVETYSAGTTSEILGVTIDEQVRQEYSLPPSYVSGKRKLADSHDGPMIKRRKNCDQAPCTSYDDDEILWHINFKQFHHHLINEMIESAVKAKIDDKAMNIVKTMLKLTMLSRDGYSDQTKSISTHEIEANMDSTAGQINRSEMLQYLSLLEDDQIGFVSKIADSSGGMYVVNVKRTVEAICKEMIQSTVKERCGSKSMRIFNLLLLKKHLEQKQVEEMIMVPSKEAKELLYNLLSEHFVSLQEVPRATDYAPSRTFYLFSVNITAVCRMLLNRSYKSLGNLINRRHHETEENKRLVEKSEKIEASITALKAQEMEDDCAAVQELEEMMTNVEKKQLEKLKKIQSKLEQSELQVSETILLFSHYLALIT